MKAKIITLFSITAAVLGARARACDMCACELPLINLVNQTGWIVGISEQYTDLGSLRLDGQTVPNPGGQYLQSSITQIFLGYNITRSFGLQINVPLISRSYQRVEGGVLETGDVSGFGDVSLLARWAPVRVERGDLLFIGRLLAGIKFPTGDSDRVLEEAGEGHHGGGGHHEGEEEHEGEEGAIQSGVHGHDLVLGTGSVDGVFGADLYLQWKRAFLDASIQVAVRGEGRNDYDFAHELNWHAGLGAVVFKSDDLNVALALQFDGASKGEDVFRGVRASDTAATVVFMGPRIAATWQQRLSADVAVGFPIARENSGVQAVPDFRVQASVGWRF